MNSKIRFFCLVTLVASAALAGCSRTVMQLPAPEPPAISVSYPVEWEVTDYAEFTGRLAAVDSVEVRAHVWGYLEKVNFEDGAIVQKGDVLFELDPRPYEAILAQAKAKVAQDEAQFAYDEAEYQRNLALVGKGAVTKSELDRTAAARNVDLANIAADKALVRQRELDLEYTKVRAPVSGRISRCNVTVGNLIQSGEQAGGTLLTTIVSVDPMYAYFDVDERTVLRVRQLIREGKVGFGPRVQLARVAGAGHRRRLSASRDDQFRGQPGQSEDRHPATARRVSQQQTSCSTRAFSAASACPSAEPHGAVLVTDRAIDNDQGQKIVYVVNEKNEVAARPVRVGALHDGLREITDGLKAGERVVVNGLQQVRPG